MDNKILSILNMGGVKYKMIEKKLFNIKIKLIKIHDFYNQSLNEEEYLIYGEEDFNSFLEIFKDLKGGLKE